MSLPLFSLKDLSRLTPSSRGYRACCPVHHGKNASALSVDEYTGVGYCFVCNRAVLLVKELQNTGGVAKHPHAPSKKPIQHFPRPPKLWQVEEHRVLCELEERMLHALLLSPRAQGYLQERGIPPRVASQIGLGYLSRRALEDPVYASRASLLYRWVNAVVFPLYSRIVDDESGQESYIQGFIGRTIKLWSPGMDEDEHKKRLNAYNNAVSVHNDQIKEQEARKKSHILRWVKTEPAGFFYPHAPGGVGPIAVLVEGGWDSAAIVTCLASMQSSSLNPALRLPPGSVIGLAGTAVHPGQLPSQVESILLAFDDDNVGNLRMHLLRNELNKAGFPTYILAQDGAGEKDWSARWRTVGASGIRPLLQAYAYVAAWRHQTPPAGEPCIILVEELTDALALLDGAVAYGCNIDASQVVVLNSGFNGGAFIRSAPRSVVLASTVVPPAWLSDSRSPQAAQRVLVAQRERTRLLFQEIAAGGIRVYHCPPPNDGLGVTWWARWKTHGEKGVSIVFDAYRHARLAVHASA